MSAKKFLKLLLKNDCVIISIRGSHHKVVNTKNGEMSIIPIHAGKDIKKSLMLDILVQLGIDSNEFIRW